MESIISLWLPILLSAVAVFIVSSVLHMVFTYHNTDYSNVPNEDQVMNDLRKHNIPPGDYMMPYCKTNKERQSDDFKNKMNKGPIAVFTVLPSGQMAMGSSLIQWFIYCVVVSIFAAYIAGFTLVPGTNYLTVFRVTSTTAFAGYSLGLLQQSIWFRKSWKTTFKSIFDGLVYALFTAGFFGWLWPVV